MPSEHFYLNTLDWSISSRKCVWLVLLLPCFIKIPIFNANSVDPDQMPCSVASDLGLHCLPVLVLEVRHKWVTVFSVGVEMPPFLLLPLLKQNLHTFFNCLFKNLTYVYFFF